MSAHLNARKLSLDALSAQLAHHHGSGQWYRHGLNRRHLHTDGVQDLAATAGAFWLIDLIALNFEPRLRRRGETFSVLLLTVCNGKAVLEAFDDLPGRLLHNEAIPWTDFPAGVFKLYLSLEPDHSVLLLPSEY